MGIISLLQFKTLFSSFLVRIKKRTGTGDSWPFNESSMRLFAKGFVVSLHEMLPLYQPFAKILDLVLSTDACSHCIHKQ
jgi:hypothetical protein